MSSPRKDAAKALYQAIAGVLAQADNYPAASHKAAFSNTVQRLTARLMPKIAKAAGMYASYKEINKGDHVIHTVYGAGIITQVFVDNYVEITFKKEVRKFSSHLVVDKLTYTKRAKKVFTKNPKMLDPGSTVA